MSDKYKFHDPDGIYFVTTTVTEWVDVFTRQDYRDIVIESLQHCQSEKGLVIHAWCIMSNHIHMIISRNGDHKLSDIMRDFKKYTSSMIVKMIQEIPESRTQWMLEVFEKAASKINRVNKFKFWQDGNHPIELFDSTIMEQKLEYIHQNPVKAGIVEDAHHYLYSSARDYSGLPGLLEIKVLIEH